MATEIAVSDQPTTPEQVEKEVQEVVKTIEQQIVTPAMDGKGDEKTKVEDLPTPAIPLSESEERIGDKQIEPPVTEEVKKTNEEEKHKTDSSPTPAVPLAESKEKIEDKQIEPIVIEDVKKADGEEKPKADSSSTPAVPLAESEEKIEDKQIETPAIEEVKKADGEEKPKADSSPTPAVPLAESLDKQIENPAVEEVKETDGEENSKADSPRPVVSLAEAEEEIQDKKIEPLVIEEVKKAGEEEKPKAEDSPSPVVLLVETEEEIRDKQIEPPVIEDVQKIDEEEKPKSEDSPSPAVPLAEAEEEIRDKQIEPPVIEDVPKTDEEEKPKAEDSPSPAVPLVESEEEIRDKQTEPPVTEEMKKTGDTTVVDVSVEDHSKVATEPDTLGISEPVSDNVKSQPEEKSVIDGVDVPDSLLESVEKKEEQVVDLPVKVSEPAAVMDVENSEAESKKEEIPKPVLPAAEKPEQSEVTEQIEKESAVVEPKEILEVEIAKNEETSDGKVEDTKLLKEEKITKDEPLVTEISSQFSTNIEDAQVDLKGDGAECPPTDITENDSKEDKEEELEGLSKEEVVASGKVGAKNVDSAEANGEVNATIESTIQPEMKEVEDVTSSVVTEKSLEVENTSRDIELLADQNWKKSIKDETLTSAENIKGKVDEITTPTIEEPVEESQKPEVEVKGEETVLTEETVKAEETVQMEEPKSEKEKEVGDIAKPDVPNRESTKDADNTQSQDPPKQGVSAKPTQKQSNNIISKVKQSLVKVKRAITGKSPNVKMPSSETQGDVKVQ